MNSFAVVFVPAGFSIVVVVVVAVVVEVVDVGC